MDGENCYRKFQYIKRAGNAARLMTVIILRARHSVENLGGTAKKDPSSQRRGSFFVYIHH